MDGMEQDRLWWKSQQKYYECIKPLDVLIRRGGLQVGVTTIEGCVYTSTRRYDRDEGKPIELNHTFLVNEDVFKEHFREVE